MASAARIKAQNKKADNSFNLILPSNIKEIENVSNNAIEMFRAKFEIYKSVNLGTTVKEIIHIPHKNLFRFLFPKKSLQNRNKIRYSANIVGNSIIKNQFIY